jgi:hypothetical protein
MGRARGGHSHQEYPEEDSVPVFEGAASVQVVAVPRSSSDRGNSLPSHKFSQFAILHPNSLCQGRYVTVAATAEVHNPEASIAKNRSQNQGSQCTTNVALMGRWLHL